MIIVVAPFTYLFSKHFSHTNTAKVFQWITLIKLITDMTAFVLQINSTFSICVFEFFAGLTRVLQANMLNTMINEVSSTGLSGMFLSAANGIKEATMNHGWSLGLIDVFGYNLCCVVGFMQQLPIILCVPLFVRWTEQGEKPETVEEGHLAIASI